MPRESTTDGRARRGYLILAALFIAAVLIFNIDAVGDLSRDQIDLVAVLPDASGIRIGTPVRVAGVEAGRVIAVSFLPAGERTEIALTVRIEGRARTVLRTDSDVRAVRLRAIGQPVVKIDPGSTRGRPVEAGDTLRGRPGADGIELMARGRALPAAVDSLLRTAEQVRAMAAAQAPELDRLQVRLAAALEAASDLSADLEGGSLGPLLGSGGVFEAVARLRSRLDEVAAALTPALARYSPSGNAELATSLEALRTRVAAVRSDLDRLSGGLEGGGIFDRMARDSAIQVAVRGVQAQMDTLRQEAASIVRRMVLP